MFNWFKETPDDKYIRALSEADGEWKISQELGILTVELHTEKEIFTFTRENWLYTYKFYEKIKDTKRQISKKFFNKIYRIAEDWVSHKQIQKVGGYILDEDLRKAISDTKKILGAHSQIEVLHAQIEQIRSKYQ